MEIYDKQESGFIQVWMNHEEQEKYDRKELTKLILEHYQPEKKCKVVYFLSGDRDLEEQTEGLLCINL